jgi:hypothetical protein
MKRKLVFIIIAALLLFPWTVAYAYGDAAASTGAAVITPAEADSLPQFNVFGKAIGSVNRGDIFTIDNTGSDSDTSFTLSLTNTDELIDDFRYMTLNIGIYIRNSDGEWEKAPFADNVNSSVYLTMQNGSVSFTLAGGAVYKVSVEKGCFYCYGSGAVKTVTLPEFYLSAG